MDVILWFVDDKMEDKIKDLRLICSEINFGYITLSEGEKNFCDDLNNEIILLCKSLPESTQTDALLFLMSYLKTSFEEGVNFLKNYYYVPSWSIVYWLIKSKYSKKKLEQRDIKNAKTAHTMAMLLHPLDDHLSDGDLPISHLVLLLRSQSWMIMNTALKSLSAGVHKGNKIVREFMDDYYSSIRKSPKFGSLDTYCNHFRKQMATWLIVPYLLTKKMHTDENFSRRIQTAFGSFGIAWRLLDDIRDIESDMMKGVHSSIYVCLSEELKRYWDKTTSNKIDVKRGCSRIILNNVLETSIIKKIVKKICLELESAASIADSYNIEHLADEFRCLLSPLKIERDHL